MNKESVFQVSGAKPYLLRYGLSAAPALAALVSSDTAQMLIFLGVGLLISAAVQWLLCRAENEAFLSTMWVANRMKVQVNKRAKSERERQKQLEARRREVIEAAKREGEAIALFFVIAGAVVMFAGFIIQ